MTATSYTFKLFGIFGVIYPGISDPALFNHILFWYLQSWVIRSHFILWYLIPHYSVLFYHLSLIPGYSALFYPVISVPRYSVSFHHVITDPALFGCILSCYLRFHVIRSLKLRKQRSRNLNGARIRIPLPRLEILIPFLIDRPFFYIIKNRFLYTESAPHFFQ